MSIKTNNYGKSGSYSKPSTTTKANSTAKDSSSTSKSTVNLSPKRDTFTYSSQTTAAKSKITASKTNAKKQTTSGSSNRDTFSGSAKMENLTRVTKTSAGTTQKSNSVKNNKTSVSSKSNAAKTNTQTKSTPTKNNNNTVTNNSVTTSSKSKILESIQKQYEHTTDSKQKVAMKKTINDIAYGIKSKEENILPVSLQDGYISADYGHTDISYHQKGHKGVDIAAPAGTPIKSSISGEVIGVFDNDTQGYRGYGNFVLVKGKDNMYYFYAHMSSVNVQIGDKVKSGDVLGGVGSTGNSTGNHLHFEIRTGGEWNSSKVNPHDYIDY